MKSYTLRQNVAYLLRDLIKWDPHYPLRFSLLALGQLVLPLLATLLPTTAVAAITGGSDLPHYLLVMTGVMVLYAAVTFFVQYMSKSIWLTEAQCRSRVLLLRGFRKTLTMDYGSLECEEGQQRARNAEYAVYNNVRGAEGAMHQFLPWVVNLLGMLLYGAVAVSVNRVIVLVLVGMAVVNYLIARYCRKYYLSHESEIYAPIRSLFYFKEQAEQAGNGKDVRLYHLAPWFVAMMNAAVKKRFTWLYFYHNRMFLGEVSDSLFLVVRDLIAYSVLCRSFLRGELDAASFTFYLGIIATFSSWLNAFVMADSDLRECSMEVTQYRQHVEAPDTMNQADGPDPRTLPLPLSISIRDVSFTYPGADTPTISHLNLEIAPGERIALVGLNGAGKTTLVKLLSGLYAPSSGEILVGGIPITAFNSAAYQKLVGTLYQDVHTLPFSVAQNVTCSEQRDDDGVWAALEKAGLKDAVKKLPKGLDTYLTQELEPDGVQLSGGQMQRLMFARALYKDPALLILDEPTAALDPLAEADLYQKYSEAVQEKTSIFISHRLSSTQFCSRILFMEHGQILEEGSHSELLSNGGAYAEMFRIQSQYYQKEAANHENGILA